MLRWKIVVRPLGHATEALQGMVIEPERIADWVVLVAQLPGKQPKAAGILLLDPATDELHIALADIDTTDADIKEVWDSLRQDLAERSSEIGGAQLLDSLELDLSLFLQIETPRQHIVMTNPETTLHELLHEHVLQRSARSNLVSAPQDPAE